MPVELQEFPDLVLLNPPDSPQFDDHCHQLTEEEAGFTESMRNLPLDVLHGRVASEPVSYTALSPQQLPAFHTRVGSPFPVMASVSVVCFHGDSVIHRHCAFPVTCLRFTVCILEMAGKGISTVDIRVPSVFAFRNITECLFLPLLLNM